MRQALGTTVFSGMLGVTLFGLFLTPVFYVVLRRSAVVRQRTPEPATARLPTESGGELSRG
jgi:HAE1 family hydrophobic/amphiphilic exporter-1